MAAHDPTNPSSARAELADLRDALAGICAVAALADADPTNVDRTGAARLIDLYFSADYAGQDAALRAIGHVLNAAQRRVWPIFKTAIPWARDWHDEKTEWPRFVAAAARSRPSRLELVQ